MKNRPAEAVEQPPLSAEEFRATPEFARFKGIMRRLLAVPKKELDRKVQLARDKSPRKDNPNAPGKKRAVKPEAE